MTGEQIAFGSRLRRERERRAIAITTIAESTKIKHSLLAALERGDASKWPAGIYRRAFIREYATAIGLASETTLSEFEQLFPESGATVPAGIDPTTSSNTLRLTLASEKRLSMRFWRQVAAAVLDVCLVGVIGATMSVVFSVPGWTLIAIAAISYYSIAAAVLGSGPALWLSNSVRARRAGASARPMPVRPGTNGLFHGIAITSRPGWTGHSDAASVPLVEQICSDDRPLALLSVGRQAARRHHQIGAVGGGESGGDAVEPARVIHFDILREHRDDIPLEMSARPS